MNYNEAEAQALQLSQDYNTIMYVVESGKKRYSVVSEARYNSRGLEEKILAIFEKGSRLD